jgi:TonB family protein
MSLLFDSTIKASLVLLLAIGAAELLNRRSAAVRHWTLAVAVACATLVPLLGLVLPAWKVPLELFAPTAVEIRAPVVSATIVVPEEEARPARPAPEVRRATAVAQAKPVAWLAWVPLIWGAGVGVSLCLLLIGLARLRWLASSAERVDRGPWVEIADEIGRRCGLRRKVTLLKSRKPTTLGTWGLMRPKVVLPEVASSWSDDRLRIVLSHELAHVRRGDWMMQLTADVLRSLYWFNPLSWVVSAELRRESEHACDDAVINAGVPAPEYASHLLDLARSLNAERRVWVPAPAMARPSSLAGRISVMLNSSVNRTPLSRTARLAAVIALLAFTISIAGFGAQRFYSLSGSVVDSTNRVVPGTTLVVVNAASKARHEVKSDQTGHFEFVGLPPGEYSLQARQPGFSTVEDTFAIVGRDLQRVIELHVGELEETITVRGSGAPSAEQQRQSDERRSRVEASRRATLEKCRPSSVGPVGGAIIPPLRLTNANPIYPAHLNSARVEGVVTMEALIGASGDVEDVRVIKSPHPELGQAAIEAVRQWQFTQTLLNCMPVEVRMRVTTNFAAQ